MAGHGSGNIVGEYTLRSLVLDDCPLILEYSPPPNNCRFDNACLILPQVQYVRHVALMWFITHSTPSFQETAHQSRPIRSRYDVNLLSVCKLLSSSSHARTFYEPTHSAISCTFVRNEFTSRIASVILTTQADCDRNKPHLRKATTFFTMASEFSVII